MFIDFTLWGRTAEIANQYLRKGRRVLIEGRLVLDQWVDQTGQKRSKHSIIAEKVQFMENKQSDDTSYNSGSVTFSEAKPQPQPQAQQMQNNQNNIPSIDIDDEEIPF